MIRKTLLIAALVGASIGAQAATVVINFKSTAFEGGSLAGQSFSGQFSFDDSLLSSSTWTLPLLSLNFSLGGQSYTLSQADADTTTAVFDGGSLVGVNAMYSVGAPSIELLAGFGTPYAHVYYSANDQGYADLSFSAAAVPEPESYALMLAGLGIVGFLSRRRKG